MIKSYKNLHSTLHFYLMIHWSVTVQKIKILRVAWLQQIKNSDMDRTLLHGQMTASAARAKPIGYTDLNHKRSSLHVLILCSRTLPNFRFPQFSLSPPAFSSLFSHQNYT